MDKRLWFKMYRQFLDDALLGATFDLRVWLGMYREQIWEILAKTPNAALQSADFLKNLGISSYQETKDVLTRTSRAADFAALGIVADEVFETLWFPERNNINEEESIYKKDAYFWALEEEKEERDIKRDYCDTLVKTETFRGRKLLFEEIFVKNIQEYQVMQGVEYTTKHDSVLRSVFQRSSLYISEFLDRIAHYCYNQYEAKLYFDILYQNIGLHSENVDDHLPEVERIIRKMRKGWQPLSRWDFTQVSKTISLLKIQGLEINYENIAKHLGVYVFIPSILSSTHGENSLSINLVKWFAKSQRPVTWKNWGRHFDLGKAILGDGETLAWVKKQKTKAKMYINTLVKKSWVDKVVTFWKNLQVWFWEKKMDMFLKYTRYFNPESLWELSHESHKEVMKNYFLIDKILHDVESTLHIRDGEVEKKPSSKVVNFLLWRGKSKSIGPFATQAWLFVSRVPIMGKLLLFLPFSKIIPILLITKTAFIFAFYKMVDIGLYFVKMIPVLERFRRFWQIQWTHTVSASPELQDLLIDNVEGLKDINRDITRIRNIKKLIVLQKKLEENKQSLDGDTTSLWEELALEISLLQAEITWLQELVNQEWLEESIQIFKLIYLDILDTQAKDSEKSFLE